MRWGKGHMVYADGDVYEGAWEENKAHGVGSYTEADGTKYTGQWNGTYRVLHSGRFMALLSGVYIHMWNSGEASWCGRA